MWMWTDYTIGCVYMRKSVMTLCTKQSHECLFFLNYIFFCVWLSITNSIGGMAQYMKYPKTAINYKVGAICKFIHFIYS